MFVSLRHGYGCLWYRLGSDSWDVSDTRGAGPGVCHRAAFLRAVTGAVPLLEEVGHDTCNPDTASRPVCLLAGPGSHRLGGIHNKLLRLLR